MLPLLNGIALLLWSSPACTYAAVLQNVNTLVAIMARSMLPLLNIMDPCPCLSPAYICVAFSQMLNPVVADISRKHHFMLPTLDSIAPILCCLPAPE